MKDSNNLHAVCLDTYPPCVYMSDVSHAAVALVHKINEVCGGRGRNDEKLIVCYTFDAGPNACLFLKEEHVPLVAGLIQHFFPPLTSEVPNFTESIGRSGIGNEETYLRGERVNPIRPDPIILKKFKGVLPAAPGSLKYVIHTAIGSGPDILSEDGCHLLDRDTGYPSFLCQ